MNLIWSNFGQMYFPRISPRMRKHCDIGHIIDPASRTDFGEGRPEIDPSEVALAFDLVARPNNQSHVIGPGTYRLDIEIAAENALPLLKVIEISLPGPWYEDPEQMLRNGVGIRMV